MLLVDMVLPILLCQLLCIKVGARHIAHLALDLFEPYLSFANIAAKDRADEHAHEEEENGYGNSLR